MLRSNNRKRNHPTHGSGIPIPNNDRGNPIVPKTQIATLPFFCFKKRHEDGSSRAVRLARAFQTIRQKAETTNDDNNAHNADPHDNGSLMSRSHHARAPTENLKTTTQINAEKNAKQTTRATCTIKGSL